MDKQGLFKILTRTRLDASGSKVELLVWVGFGLIGGGIVDSRWRTVLLTHTTVVEVAARLERRGMTKHVTPEMTYDCEMR